MEIAEAIFKIVAIAEFVLTWVRSGVPGYIVDWLIADELRPADKSQGEGRFADTAFTTTAWDGHAEASARKAAKTSPVKNPESRVF